jgi:hypothetical protein
LGHIGTTGKQTILFESKEPIRDQQLKNKANSKVNEKMKVAAMNITRTSQNTVDYVDEVERIMDLTAESRRGFRHKTSIKQRNPASPSNKGDQTIGSPPHLGGDNTSGSAKSKHRKGVEVLSLSPKNMKSTPYT